MKNNTFARQVREKYGDSVPEFALRLGVAPMTVKRWENGDQVNALHQTLLEYSNKYDLGVNHQAPEEFVELTPEVQIEYLMKYYGCSLTSLSVRIGVTYATIFRWKTKNKLSPAAQRLLYEMAANPDRFLMFK